MWTSESSNADLLPLTLAAGLGLEAPPWRRTHAFTHVRTRGPRRLRQHMHHGLHFPMLDATIHRPALTLAAAARIASQHFALAGDVTELPSERDRNFRVTNESGEAFVLKVSTEAEAFSQLQCENEALAWIAERAPSVPVPRVLSDSNGEFIARVEAPDGVEHFARVITFLPGKVLADVVPHSMPLLEDLGAGLGTLDSALAGFDHDATKREFLWDLARARIVIEQQRR